MNPRLKLLNIYIPGSIKRNKLKDLFQLTADAFGCPVPNDLKNLSYMDLLNTYANFAHEKARLAVVQNRQIAALRERLFKNAFELGQKIRKDLQINSMQELMDASKILYRMLGIAFDGNIKGEIMIRRCFFSRFFSEEDCKIISSLDEGIAAGLSGGGKLVFSQRITEGKPSCRARLVFGNENP